MTDGNHAIMQAALREAAERRAETSPPDLWQAWTPGNLTHELGVYHVELELQAEELRTAVSALDTERQHYQTLYEHAPAAYFTLNARGDILSVNQAGLSLLNDQKTRLVARRLALFIVPAQRSGFHRLLADLLADRVTTSHQFTLERADGERLEVQLQGFALPDATNASPDLLVALMDVTPLFQARTHLEQLNTTLDDRIREGTQQLRDLNARLRHQALHDHLTGLPNRAAFADTLKGALGTLHHTGQRFAVLYLDLDRFKLINDTLGHTAGDQVLLELAGRLRASTRPSDQVARLGGDEFAMLLHDITELQTVLTVIRRLEAAVQRPVFYERQELSLMISTGVLMVTERYSTAEEILGDVDLALYQAKRGGRAAARVYEPAMREAVQGRLELEAQLRHALDRQELVVHYQPIVALQGGAVLGLEALVRWNHPARGLLSAEVFMPLAEELGLSAQIDQQVVREAQLQMASWQTGGAPPQGLWMNINVSADSLEHVRQVTEELVRQPTPEPWHVLIEITERVLTRSEATDPETLEILRRARIELVVDDFGTGYSSLSSLHRFPVRMLKIDRAFIGSLEEGPELVRAMLKMGEALGMVVVAEGVETEDQQRRLQEIGVEVVQGWLYGPPLPPDQIEAYLRQHRHIG